MTTTTVSIPPPGGTVVIADTTAIAITTLLGPTAATSLPFSIPALLSAIEEDSQATVRQLMILNENVETLTGAIQGVSEQLKLGNFASTKISGSMNEMNVNGKLALAETRRNNAFQQQTTNQALVDSGKPPTEVKPQAIQVAIENAVADYSLQNAQVKAIGLVEEGASTVLTYAVTATEEALVATGIADFFSENLLKLKVGIVGIFSEKQAARILEEARLKATKARRNPG
jgi:hypothetical protein